MHTAPALCPRVTLDAFCMPAARLQETVIAGGVKVCFQTYESPNGTNEQRGQFPELLIRVGPGSA